MCIKLCSFQYYISKKLKNSDFEAKNKKRAEKGGNGIYRLWKWYFKWTFEQKDSYKFVQIREQCNFERYHSGYLTLVKIGPFSQFELPIEERPLTKAEAIVQSMYDHA